MLERENIDKRSFLYWLIKVGFTKSMHDYFYRKQKMVHADRIPKDQPVIIAPNHQNALMDAMAFVAGLKPQIVFLARADMFRRKFIIKLLTFIKILPVFRIRDGMSNLQKNEEIFDLTVNILHNRQCPLLLFPEGNHGNRRRLRPLVKGIFRIAFQAQERYGEEPGVKIVPAGIDYSHYWKFRQTQLVIFGEPIEVNQYWKAYKENPSVAINQLREHLAGEIRKLMIDIKTEEYYFLYMDLRTSYGPSFCRMLNADPSDLYEKFLTDKQLIAKLDDCLEHEPEKIRKLNEVYEEYRTLRDGLNFRNWVPQKNKYNIILNILLIILSPVVWPLVILGLFNNWVNFFLPPLIKQRLKDTQFFSTAVWASAYAGTILYHSALIILALVFLPLWWIKLLYIVTVPSSGLFALGYRNFLVKSWAKIRYSFQMRKKGSSADKMKLLHDRLLQLAKEIAAAY